MNTEKFVLNEDRNVILTAILHENLPDKTDTSGHPAILVLPGGGYAVHTEQEAETAAEPFYQAGYQAFVLRYTLKDKGGWPYPLDDYEQAMELILNHTNEWGIDSERIVAVGFSAGGHLCACAATIATHKPAAALLVYPAILKELCDMCQPGMPCPSEYVTPDTAPCFLVAARDDGSADVNNILAMEQALSKNGVAFESHIYSYGGHGFGIGTNREAISERVPRWVEDSMGWLRELLGYYTPMGYSKPKISSNIHRNLDPMLSVQCTVGYLRHKQGTVQKLLEPVMDAAENLIKLLNIPMEDPFSIIDGCTLFNLLCTLRIPEEQVEQMDASLRKIENK